MDESLFFEGHPLDFQWVTDPEFILWENLKTSEWSKFWRKLLSAFMVLIAAVAASAGLIYYQNWIDDYETGLEQLSDEDES
jgi:hypothetical protein